VLLKDIAIRSGLTINTVSRALKDKPDISLKTRAYVKELATQMGYVPDVVASSLRSGMSKTIGVMFDNINNPYFMIMTDLIHKHLKEEGYDLMIFTSSGENAQFDMASFNKLIARRIDGIISFLKPTEEVRQYVNQKNLPFVIIGREGDDIGIDSIYTNDLLGGYEVGKHLIALGHKKIGYLGAPSDILCSTKRLDGLIKACEEEKLTLIEEDIHFLKHGEMVLEPHVVRLLDQKVTAIFCFNDSMAYEVISILHQKNIGLDQVSIVGYDNIENYLKIPVGLTSVESNKDEMVVKAINALFTRLDNPKAPRFKEVNGVNLIVRSSTTRL